MNYRNKSVQSLYFHNNSKTQAYALCLGMYKNVEKRMQRTKQQKASNVGFNQILLIASKTKRFRHFVHQTRRRAGNCDCINHLSPCLHSPNSTLPFNYRRTGVFFLTSSTLHPSSWPILPTFNTGQIRLRYGTYRTKPFNEISPEQQSDKDKIIELNPGQKQKRFSL